MKKNTAAQKLLSQRGASLAYALLLFIVCSAVGAVVLTAGSAASGRISALAEMDSRYYAVTSAAGLLAELFDGTSVTITESVSQELDDEGNETGDPSYGYSVGDSAQICRETAAWLLYGMSAADLDDADELLPENSGEITKTYTITVKNPDGSDVIQGYDAENQPIVLKTDIVETMKPGGNLIITVTGRSGGSTGPEFSLPLIFQTGISKRSDSEEGESSLTERNHTTIEWHLEKVGG